ncbi:MAG: 5-bromo-4-chloroindolyl phosphate hydrolysis family protein [Oscillospiraceae bacterium]|nr:5-bromo-4-chloroindolyl phosphate hydrolysis family protein [Oscillospiraceae bacterium]
MKKNNNYNNSAKNTDMLFGFLAIFGSLVAPLIFLIAAAFAGAVEDDVWLFAHVILSGLLFCVVWLVHGIRAIIRADRSKKYAKAFGKSPRVKIAQVIREVGGTLRSVSSDLLMLRARGYFREIDFDLNYKEVILDNTDKADEPLPAEAGFSGEDECVYEVKSEFPLWAVVVAISAMLPFVSMNVLALIFGVAVSTGATLLSLHFFPRPKFFVEVKRVGTVLVRPAATGNEDYDSARSRIFENHSEMLRLSREIRSRKIREPLGQIMKTLSEISEYITANPSKARTLRQFSNYYLPTTVDLLKTYEELESKPDNLKGANIAEAMVKIEGIVANMVVVFKQEYDELFVDRAMDVSAEVAVMESLIKEHRETENTENI